jgi:hypothetical protein
VIQTLIFNAISASPDVIALAGSRIYPIRLPRDSELPAVVYRISSITPTTSMSGDSGIDNNSVEIVCWAKEYGVAHQLADAVRKALVGESGLRIITDSQDDEEDLETRSYAVNSRFSIWSAFNMGSSPEQMMDPIFEIGTLAIDGDGETVEFAIPKFREDSLVLFINGRLGLKGVGGEYVEKETRDGVVFFTPPAGEPYVDRMLAYFARV